MNPVVVYRFQSNAEKKLFPLFEKADLELGNTFHSLKVAVKLKAAKDYRTRVIANSICDVDIGL